MWKYTPNECSFQVFTELMNYFNIFEKEDEFPIPHFGQNGQVLSVRVLDFHEKENLDGKYDCKFP